MARWRWVLMGAALCLLAGAVLNVLVAWALAAWGRGGVTAANFAGSTAIRIPKQGAPTIQYSRCTIEAHGIGWSSEAVDSQTSPPTGLFTLDMRWRAGWPLHSVGAHHGATSAQPSFVMMAPPRVRAGLISGLPVKGGYERRLPFLPLWPGFLVNSALFALIPVAIVACVVLRRSRHRRYAGCCGNCGYPIGLSPVCTECGAELPAATAPTPDVTTPDPCADPPSPS